MIIKNFGQTRIRITSYISAARFIRIGEAVIMGKGASLIRVTFELAILPLKGANVFERSLRRLL